LKAIQHIFKVANPTRNNIFSHEDIDKLLFFHGFPLKQAYPFSTFPKFKNVPIVYRIYMRRDSEDLETYLNNTIYSVGRYIVRGGIASLNVSLVNNLIVELNKLLAKWQEYLLIELNAYTKTPMSQLHWASLNKVPGLLGTELLYEQKLWISACTSNDKNNWYKDVSDVRDSVLPYMNPELWDKMRHYKEEVHQNADYEKDRADMLLGKFNSGDIKLPDDLDIIT